MDNLDAMFGDDEGVVENNTPDIKESEKKQETEKVEKKEPEKEVPAVTKKEEVAGVDDSFEIGIPEELQSSLEELGVVVGDIGTKVSKVPIDKYKASSSKVDRISLLTNKVIAIKFHYIEGVGSIMCFGGKCCDVGGTPQVRYLFPIAVYSTDAEGNISGKKVELKILSAGDDLYKSIVTINKGCTEYGGIDHVDLLVTCTDDKFQKISLSFAGQAVWRKYSSIANFLSERWKKDAGNAYMAVARKCDEATFIKLAGLEDNSDDGNYNDVIADEDISKFFND